MTFRSLNNAVVLLDKPVGRTSFDVIKDLRRYGNVKKTGHSGTLDKFASGLLVACTGKFTKLTQYFLESDKRYTGTIQLGIETDTCDITGEVVSKKDFSLISEEKIIESVSLLKGIVSQIPPGYSALKVKGKRASDRMRKGEEVVLKPRNVEILNFDIRSIDLEQGILEFDISCSKGTYIRSIARDLGKMLGTGACLAALRRLESGDFNVANALSPDLIAEYMKGAIEPFFIIEPQVALKSFGRLLLDSNGAERVSNGAFFTRESVKKMEIDHCSKVLILDEKENLIAIAEIDVDKWLISYDSVFNQECN